MANNTNKVIYYTKYNKQTYRQMHVHIIFYINASDPACTVMDRNSFSRSNVKVKAIWWNEKIALINIMSNTGPIHFYTMMQGILFVKHTYDGMYNRKSIPRLSSKVKLIKIFTNLSKHKVSKSHFDKILGLALSASHKACGLASWEWHLIARLDLCPAPTRWRGEGRDGSRQ